MKRFRTLRARFALWTAALLLVVLAAFGVYVYGSLARGLFAALDNSLTLSAAQVAAELDIQNGQISVPNGFAEEPEIVNLRGRGFTIRILSPQGQILEALGPFTDLPVSALPSFATWVDPTSQTTIRLYTLLVEEDNRPITLVQVAQSLGDLQATLQQLLVALLVSVPLLMVVTGIGGYFLAARALAPIDRITRTARRIAGGAEDLSARLNLPMTDDEVGRLAETFDAMLARLDDTFRRERQFAADASHELRTPLTAMQAILGVIRETRRTPEEYEQALTDLADETDRLRTLAENLLRLARGDRRAPPDVVDLSTLLADVAASWRPLAEAKALTLACEVPDGLTLMGDRDDLIRVFVNLLDNAIKYTERGGMTVLARLNQDNRVSVSVSDTGVGMAAEHLPYIFDRFYRVDKSRTKRGIGLGLAIALTIVRVHGGTIDVRSTMGQGTVFTVYLPKNHEPPPNPHLAKPPPV